MKNILIGLTLALLGSATSVSAQEAGDILGGHPRIVQVSLNGCGDDEKRSQYFVMLTFWTRVNFVSQPPLLKAGCAMGNASGQISGYSGNAAAVAALNAKTGGCAPVFFDVMAAPYNGIAPPGSRVWVYTTSNPDLSYLGPTDLADLCGVRPVLVVFGNYAGEAPLFQNAQSAGASCGAYSAIESTVYDNSGRPYKEVVRYDPQQFVANGSGIGPNGAPLPASPNCAPTSLLCPNPPVVTFSGKRRVCEGEGAVITAQTTSVGNYSYTWNTGVTGPALPVVPGITTDYTVTVKNQQNTACATVATFTLEVASAPAFELASDGPKCAGQPVRLRTLHADDAGIGQYAWSGPAGFAATDRSPLVPVVGPAQTGAYTLKVTFGGNCTAEKQLAVTTKAVVPIKICSNTPVCTGEMVLLQPDLAGASYAWSGPAGFMATTQSLTLTNPAAGTYTVSITDGDGCTQVGEAKITTKQCAVTAAINGFVWHDKNRDGQQTTGEPGISGVEVALWPGEGATALHTAVTDASGRYLFEGLSVGNYRVFFTQPAGYQRTAANLGGDEALDSDASVGDGFTAVLSVTAGESIIAVDAGYQRSCSFDLLPAALAAQPVRCYNEFNGALSLSASGGAVPYQYDWADLSGTINPANRSDLLPGAYTVTITDAEGCTASATAQINQPQPLAANAIAAHINCYDGTTGAITLAVSGGNAPYVFNWLDVPGGSELQNRASLPAGNYRVTVTDSKGCTTVALADLTEPVRLTANAISTAASCRNALAGKSELSVAGGVSPYTYNWSDGRLAQKDRIDLAPGTHSVTITDAKGCAAVASVIVDDLGGPVVSTGGAVTICSGRNVDLLAAVTGGANPLTYTWSNGSNSATQAITPAATTTYTVTVADANGCTSTADKLVTVNTTPTAVLNADKSSVCSRVKVILTATGGGTYLWSNSLGTNAVVNVYPVSTTSYTVTMTHPSGCTATATKSIIVNPSPVASISPAADPWVLCRGSSVMLTASGGTGYSWSNDWPPITGPSHTVSPTVNTTYRVTVSNEFGCTATATRKVNVVTGDPSFATISTYPEVGDAPICPGQEISLYASSSDYYVEYDWGGGITGTLTVTPLVTSTYTVTVRNLDGCMTIERKTINVRPPIVASISPAAPTVCAGRAVVLTASGGGRTYQWSNNLGVGASVTVSPTINTTYTVTITDASGCSAVVSKQVTVLPGGPLAASISTTINQICPGSPVQLTAGGGGTYAWSNGLGNAPTVTASPSVNTTYIVTVTNTNGCTATASKSITMLPAPVASIGPLTNGICQGGALSITAGGNGTYSWSDNLGTNATVIVSPTATKQYTVTVTAANGCSTTASRTIFVSTNLAPVISITPENPKICKTNTLYLTANGGGTYAWSQGLGTNQSITVSPAVTTTYTVTVTSINGCESIASRTVVVNPLPTASIQTTGSSSCALNENILLTAVGGSTYLWSTGASAPTISVTRTAVSTNYTVTVTDINGCTASSLTTIGNTGSLNATASVTNANCHGNMGTISLNVQGGNAPYTYRWSDGKNSNYGSVSAGTYTVTITDNTSCTTTLTTTVLQPSPYTITSDDWGGIQCAGTASGRIDLSVSGSNGGYSFRWADLPGNTVHPQNRQNLKAGDYTVIVSDSKGCTARRTHTLVGGAFDVMLSLMPTPSSCQTNTGGSIGVSLNEQGIYTYHWSNGGTSKDLANLSAGTYTLTVTEVSLGCSVTKSATVTHPFIEDNTIPIAFQFCEDTNEGVIRVGALLGPPRSGSSVTYWSTNDYGRPGDVLSGTLYAPANQCQGRKFSVTILPTTFPCFGGNAAQNTYKENLGYFKNRYEPINLYPNPANNTVTIQLPVSIDETIWKVVIVDPLGCVVYEQPQESAFDIDLAVWPQGLYLVKVQWENKMGDKAVFWKKLIVQRK